MSETYGRSALLIATTWPWCTC